MKFLIPNNKTHREKGGVIKRKATKQAFKCGVFIFFQTGNETNTTIGQKREQEER